MFIILVAIFMGNTLMQYEKYINDNVREKHAQDVAKEQWEACLEQYAGQSCNVEKDKPDQKKVCQEAQKCILKGYEEPLSWNILESIGASVKDTSTVITSIILIGMYICRWCVQPLYFYFGYNVVVFGGIKASSWCSSS